MVLHKTETVIKAFLFHIILSNNIILYKYIKWKLLEGLFYPQDHPVNIEHEILHWNILAQNRNYQKSVAM